MIPFNGFNNFLCYGSLTLVLTKSVYIHVVSELSKSTICFFNSQVTVLVTVMQNNFLISFDYSSRYAF